MVPVAREVILCSTATDWETCVRADTSTPVTFSMAARWASASARRLAASGSALSAGDQPSAVTVSSFGPRAGA
ncbi:MAG: hypothetical protein A2506_05270 [Elusimicrobia bacterium RIFOXYD12_FULL_66_9]|nr:MAG: hypothetical protein A2506_05270 [Elusimicrobia bacterium RIFOXYD12_FULL_66_9]